ncbi:MAG: SWIM zinc finger family protein [Pyrinomonadaceae bacterium]
MADFSANDYDRFIDNLEKAAQAKRTRTDSIEPGSHILVFNSIWSGRDETKAKTWHRVESLTRFSDGILEMLCTDGRKVLSDDVLLVANEKALDTMLICLNDREREFIEALARADKNNLEVFHDFEKDSFVVVNHDNGKEYRVVLKTIKGKVFASCECSDFIKRNRLCKHQAEVLRDTFSDVPQPIEQAGELEPMRNLMTRLSGAAAAV